MSADTPATCTNLPLIHKIALIHKNSHSNRILESFTRIAIKKLRDKSRQKVIVFFLQLFRFIYRSQSRFYFLSQEKVILIVKLARLLVHKILGPASLWVTLSLKTIFARQK